MLDIYDCLSALPHGAERRGGALDLGGAQLRETEAPARRAGGAAEREQHGTEKRGRRKNDDETEKSGVEHVRDLPVLRG
jgi:hypothetical protein